MSEAGFRIVAAYRDALQAETAVELLRSAGIEARVPDAYGANPLPSLALGWVRILVREADAGPARDLLRALMFDLQARTRAARRPRFALCEACGSEAIVPAPWAVWPGRLSLWGFRLPFPRYGPSRRCVICGHLGPRVRGGPRPEPPLHPAFERAIAVYEAGLRGRLVRALKRVAVHKMREAVRTALAEEAARRRKSIAERYEAVRVAAIAAVAAGLASEADRDLLIAQADLAWDEILALERRPDALTGPARRILTRLAAEARRRADLTDS